jgi:hypothetical protein
MSLLILALAVQAGAQAGSAGSGGLRYSMAIEPPRPEAADRLALALTVEGISASSSRVAELRLGPGLALASESIRPFVSASARGAEFRFELQALGPGERRIEALVIVAAEGKLVLGPLTVRAAAAGAPEDTGAWSWVAPSQALRYEAFEIRLESAAAGAGADSLEASFAPPQGASVEPSGRLSWTVMAFEEGALVLPEAKLGKGKGAGIARARQVSILALPPELSSSRAIGDFSLTLREEKRPSSARPAAGVALRFRLTLGGRGNLPALVLPEPSILLGAGPASGAWTASRADDSRPEAGSYAGSASLVVEVVPPRPGLLRLSFPPMAALDRGSGLVALEVPALELEIGAGAPTQSVRDRGGEGKSLAELYGALRRAPPLSREARVLRKRAIARASELGTSPPFLDALPPPAIFAWAAFPVACTGLGLFIAWRPRALKERFPQVRRALLAAVLALCLVLVALCALSAIERRAVYAVVWADALKTIPSADSALPVAVVRGSTARLRGASGQYAGVILSDGLQGWVLRDSLFTY